MTIMITILIAYCNGNVTDQHFLCNYLSCTSFGKINFMKNIFYYLAVGLSFIIASACHTTKQANNGDNNTIARKWMLKTIDSVDNDLVLKSKAYIDLTNEKNAGAKAGCNGMGFGIKYTGKNNISFTQGMSTQMYCAEFMPAEHGLSAALLKVKKYSIEAHKITFTDTTGKVLITGVATDWD